ncbi:S9 family peptidase [Corallococcus silvisoli]|uniref:S9 family peptidase n=1 Tax=Corallococcus silvisoli TaxID=2697031 RepID=UPI001377660D|nr:S9 family peptidase [Corallococcus silvisoli]NBD09806.1 prolyl oligopeptidase family serine peptidase [Corallococcus silvisoli]
MRAGSLGWVLGLGVWGALASAAVPVSARPDVGATYDALQRAVRIKQVALSPEGARVAWVEWVPGTAESTRLQVRELAHPERAPVRITASKDGAPCAEGSLAWSPDGRRLAFLSTAGEGTARQLYVADASGEGGPARRLTTLKGVLATPKWSPDGTSVGVLAIEGAEDAQGPLGPAARETGVVQESSPVKRFAVVSVEDARLRLVSPAGLFIYEYAWSPDGARVAVTAAPPPGDANWWDARVYAVEAATGETSLLHAPTWQVAEPAWSPDGKQLAFIEGLMSDEGSTGGDVLVVSVPERLAAKLRPGEKAEFPAKVPPARNLTEGLKATATDLFWSTPERLVFAAQAQGEAALMAAPPRGGAVETLWRGPEHVAVSLGRDGVTSAVVRDAVNRAPEVWTGPLGAWKQVTRLNVDVTVPVGEVRSVTWTSDGQPVQGWLVLPVPELSGRKAPMVTVVHGGPAAGVLSTFSPQTALLVARGYAVFMPNPRGSYGQGEAFVQANRRDFGYGDFRDVLAGVDAVLASAPVDPARQGIMGWSYGGFLTMWAVTRTQRFQAAVAGAGIANWQSYYGTNHIDTWMLPYFGASVYDEPEVYTRSSPINGVKQVRTPTLVLHGERDVEVPASQGYEFHRALKTLGVKTQLVIYADEGHGLRKPEHQKDRLLRTLDWFDANLPAAAVAPGPKVRPSAR